MKKYNHKTLEIFVKNWLNAYINENLGDLINLTTNNSRKKTNPRS